MPQLEYKWPNDNQDDLIAFYGDPGKDQVAAQLVKVVPPFQMTYEGTPVTSLLFHKKASDALLSALHTIWDYYGHDQATIDHLGISKYDGTYNKRFIRGSSTRWSNHAFGAAIDINAEENGFNVEGDIPLPMIAAFKAQGARWGGDYHGRTDPMHFEFCDNGQPPQEFEWWLAHYGVIKPLVNDPIHSEPDPDPENIANISYDMRLSMAKHIMNFEARRDANGHLAVYNLPPNDGGGRWEIAGINERYDGPELIKLKGMLDAGKYDDAEKEAELYYLSDTKAAMLWTSNAGVEFYLRDTIFNRGLGGCGKILQFACGMGEWSNHSIIDGQIGDKSKAAIKQFDDKPDQLLSNLRTAREGYERNVVGYRANFWNGLTNRWNKALEVAKEFSAEQAKA